MKEDILDKLTKYGQQHLLSFYDELKDYEKEELVKKLSETDFSMMANLYKNSYFDNEIDLNTISPIEYTASNEIPDGDKNRYIESGISVLKNGEYAIVMMAGGNGSRLGHFAPKATYELNVNGISKSLFEFFIDNLKECNLKYGSFVSIYIMTSRQNDEETKKYFTNNHYFGYPKEKIAFFVQDELPILDTSGAMLLSSKSTLLEGPNGNGNVYFALDKSGCLDKMKNDNVKWVFITGSDNILVKLCDPLFIGLTKENDYQLASKSVFKEDANSKTYVFARIMGKPNIINPKLVDGNDKSIDNRYLYRDINIVNHLMDISLLDKFSKVKLPYNRTFKKTEYMDNSGTIVIPTAPNSFKFEQFIFEAFPYCNDMLIFRVKSDDEFAPLKNASGDDSPDIVVQKYLNQHNK